MIFYIDYTNNWYKYDIFYINDTYNWCKNTMHVDLDVRILSQEKNIF